MEKYRDDNHVICNPAVKPCLRFAAVFSKFRTKLHLPIILLSIWGRDYSSLLSLSLESLALTSKESISLFFMKAMIIPVPVRKRINMSNPIDSIIHSFRCGIANWAKVPTILCHNLMGGLRLSGP